MVELQLNVDLAGGGPGEVAYRWLDEVSRAQAPQSRAVVASLPARIGSGSLGEPGDVFGYLRVDRWSDGRPPRGQERHASDAGMRWLREQLRDVPRKAWLWFGNLDERGHRSGDLASATVERHAAAPDMIVLTTHVAESLLTDPVDGARVQRFFLDLLFRFADQVNPAFGHIAYYEQGSTAFEAGLRNIDAVPPPQWWSFPRVLTACRDWLRGYSWLTILPEELLDRVGGLDALAGSGAFAEVRPLTAGGVWLLATDDYRDFGDGALLRVFHTLTPALRPGPITLWPPPPGQPPLRVVPKDAGRSSTGRSRDAVGGHGDAGSEDAGDPTTPFWWTVTVERPDPAPVEMAPAGPDQIAQPVRMPGAGRLHTGVADGRGRPADGRLTATAGSGPAGRHLRRPDGRRVHRTTRRRRGLRRHRSRPGHCVEAPLRAVRPAEAHLHPHLR
jgi:hypothetical protein